MQSKYIKILICLVLVVAFSLAIATPSYAIPLPIVVGGAGLAVGGLAWAIANAMGVSFDMSNYTSQTIDTSFDPWYTVQTALNTSDFTFIKAIRSGYDALQLSLTAYNAIKEASSNIITENDIQDNDTGTLQNKEAFDVLIGVSFATIDWTDSAIATPDGGSLYITGAQSTYPSLNYSGGLFDNWSTGSRFKNNFPMSIRYIQNANGTLSMQFKYANGSTWTTIGGTKTAPVVSTDMDYVSDVVDTSFGDLALQNVTVVFPQTVLPSTATLDEIVSAINNLALQGSEDVTVEIDTAPPPPIPTSPLGEVPYDEWIDTFGQSVYDKLDEQTDAIDNYGQSAIEALEDVEDTVDTVGQEVVDAVDAVDTNIQAGNGILSGIRSLVGSAVDTLENIGEMVGELVEDIVLGTETLISGILNQIPSLFNVILSPIKTAASIWHYVVEWIQSIAGPFQFIWSMANGTSYYIVLPVYASLAAAVVLAFYKRFGK